MSILRAALGSLRAQGLRAAASLPSASSLWAARAFVFAAPPPPARAAPLQPLPLLQQLLQRLQPEPQLALVGLESPPPAPLAAAAAALADAFSILTMNRNKREPRKANHGARPCSSVRRKRKYDTRANEHPYIPTSKLLRKKNVDY